MIIYKSFINLLYGLILIVEMLFMTNRLTHHFQIKLSLHFKLVQAITGAIKASFCDQLYQVLSLKNLHERSWMRRLCFL